MKKKNWKIIFQKIKKLQQRIVKAVKRNKFNKAKKLIWLLTNSYYAKVLSVIRVITNKGGKTAGVDGVIWNIETDIEKAVKSLKRRGYKPKPLLRIYIPKKNGKKRPLSIPTLKDRAMQALHKFALEPVAETLADPNSYGFRMYRSCQDAIQKIFVCLARKDSAKWILDADIKSCFDKIDHKWLMDNVLMDKVILRKWLKAGYIEKQHLYPTKEGTPQGGIISPTLMNITLDGLEKVIRSKFKKWKGQSVNFVRYADDFVVTAKTPEILKEVKLIIENFLKIRGLTLSDEKTKISHIDDGFNFLSQNIRKYNGKLLIKPTKQAIKDAKYKIRKIVFGNLNAKPQILIKKLNAFLRGWGNYHRYNVAKEIFKSIDYYTWQLLGKWCKRRHPNKAWKWITYKYFTVSQENCTFSSLTTAKKKGKLFIHKLVRLAYVPIIRHTKIKSETNPFNKADDEYFKQFREKKQKKFRKSQQKQKTLTNFADIDKQLLKLWKL